ncbi:hypothetical protein ACNKHL_00090 [Shigella flexneri]
MPRNDTNNLALNFLFVAL